MASINFKILSNLRLKIFNFRTKAYFARGLYKKRLHFQKPPMGPGFKSKSALEAKK